MRFYQIEDRTLSGRGMPWIAEFTEGVVCMDGCTACGGRRWIPTGELRAQLDARRGTQWPDLIGSGHLVGLFVASGRFVDALSQECVRVELGGRVKFAEPTPKRLSLADAPDYHWVDGARLRAARLDFEASGYVRVKHCNVCGRWWDDVTASNPRDCPVVFDYDTASGLDLFTTDMGPRVFYCTHRVLDCARKHRLTNIAFTPVEEGPFGKPVRYWQ